MTKSKKYKVIRGIQRDGIWRHEPGDVVTAAKLKGADIEHWLAVGVLEEVTDGDS